MVEGEVWYVVEGKPLGTRGIVATLHRQFPRQGVERDGDDAVAWVAVHVAERPHLLDVAQVQPRFLFQFAQCALFGGLVHLEEAAREGPAAFERLNSALDEQDFEVAPVEAEHHTVCRHGWAGILVSVALLFHLV